MTSRMKRSNAARPAVRMQKARTLFSSVKQNSERKALQIGGDGVCKGGSAHHTCAWTNNKGGTRP